MTVRLMGLPTRETNSSQASSSRGPVQRQMTSCRDKDEYRVGLGVFDILFFLVKAPRSCFSGDHCKDDREDHWFLKLFANNAGAEQERAKMTKWQPAHCVHRVPHFGDCVRSLRLIKDI
jgi:hypothetical protein